MFHYISARPAFDSELLFGHHHHHHHPGYLAYNPYAARQQYIERERQRRIRKLRLLEAQRREAERLARVAQYEQEMLDRYLAQNSNRSFNGKQVKNDAQDNGQVASLSSNDDKGHYFARTVRQTLGSNGEHITEEHYSSSYLPRDIKFVTTTQKDGNEDAQTGGENNNNDSSNTTALASAHRDDNDFRVSNSPNFGLDNFLNFALDNSFGTIDKFFSGDDENTFGHQPFKQSLAQLYDRLGKFEENQDLKEAKEAISKALNHETVNDNEMSINNNDGNTSKADEPSSSSASTRTTIDSVPDEPEQPSKVSKQEKSNSTDDSDRTWVPPSRSPDEDI